MRELSGAEELGHRQPRAGWPSLGARASSRGPSRARGGLSTQYAGPLPRQRVCHPHPLPAAGEVLGGARQGDTSVILFLLAVPVCGILFCWGGYVDLTIRRLQTPGSTAAVSFSASSSWLRTHAAALSLRVKLLLPPPALQFEQSRPPREGPAASGCTPTSAPLPLPPASSR